MFKLNTIYILRKNSLVFELEVTEFYDYAKNIGYEIKIFIENKYHYYYAKRKEYLDISKEIKSEIIINWYNHYLDCHRLNASSEAIDIRVPIKSKNLGSLILNNLIGWCRERYPDIKMKDLLLSSVDEQELENKLRRNKLYTNLGYLIDDGKARGKLAKDMTPSNSNFGFEILQILQ